LRQRGLRALQLRFGRGERRLILRRIDLIEQGAFLYVLAAAKSDALQDATHLRTHVDRLDRFDMADELAAAVQLLPMHGLGHDRRGRCACRARRLRVQRKRGRQQHQQRGGVSHAVSVQMDRP